MSSPGAFIGSAYPLYPDPLPFTWNLLQGGRRWRDALGRVRDVKFGVDVLVLGDSTSTYGDWYSCWPHRLKVLLQERFNDPNTPGGFGFMPFGTGAYANLWTFAGAGWSDASPFYIYNNNSNPGTGYLQATCIAPAGTTNKIYRQFNGTVAAAKWKRDFITDWEYVGLSYPGVAPDVYCDSGNLAAPQAAANLVNGYDGVGGSSSKWGEHWVRQTGLTRTNNNYVQVTCPVGAGHQLWANGIIAYDGDYSEGVRLHNLSQPSWDSDFMLSGAGSGNQPQAIQANLDQFCTGVTGGARNAKLVIINTMLNDCGATSQTRSVATYKANLQTMITAALAQTTKPCVCLVVNQPWSTTIANAAALLRYSGYRDAVYQLANSNDNVFVVDFWKVLTDATNPQYAPHGVNSAGGAMFDRGWYNDGTHPMDTGNFARARMLFAALSYGV